jgi:PadR family transcriptional regulator PadR
MEAELDWPGEWLRGVLEVCVLQVVSWGPTYGYAIAATLDQAGLGAPKGGTLYPLLGRIEAAGWVVSGWRAGDGGPGRKFYELTPAGADALAARLASWARFAETVDGLLRAGQPTAPGPDRQSPTNRLQEVSA